MKTNHESLDRWVTETSWAIYAIHWVWHHPNRHPWAVVNPRQPHHLIRPLRNPKSNPHPGSPNPRQR